MRLIRGANINPDKAQAARVMRRAPTMAERVLWRELRNNRLAGLHFRRQQVIEGFIVDFYCHKARLVVEVDGQIHDAQVEEDKRREAILREARLLVVRVTDKQVLEDLAGALALI